MLAQAKVDELVNWLWDEWLDDGSSEMKSILRDKVDDALNDAYGSGEKDEQRAACRYLRRVGLPVAAMALEEGRHTPPNPDHAALVAKAMQIGKEPPTAG